MLGFQTSLNSIEVAVILNVTKGHQDKLNLENTSFFLNLEYSGKYSTQMHVLLIKR